MLASPVNPAPELSTDADLSRDALRSAGSSVPSADVSSIESLLVLSRVDSPAESVLLTPGRWSIGTANGNRLQIAGESVAARHCLVIATERRTIMRSWDAQTWLNGRPATDAQLTRGDKLKLGDVCFQLRAAESSEVISQLPDIPETAAAEAHDDGHATPAVSDVLSRMDQLCDVVNTLDDEYHGRPTSADRLDQLIDGLQQRTAPHVSAADSETADELTENAMDGDGELDGILSRVDRSVPGDEFSATEAAARDLDERRRELETFSSSLEVRAAVIEAQALELDASVAQFERERREIADAWSQIRQERAAVELQRQNLDGREHDLRHDREEVELQREAISDEAGELKQLYATLSREFGDHALERAAGENDSHVETALEEQLGVEELPDVDTVAADRTADEHCPAEQIADPSDVMHSLFGTPVQNHDSTSSQRYEVDLEGETIAEEPVDHFGVTWNAEDVPTRFPLPALSDVADTQTTGENELPTANEETQPSAGPDSGTEPASQNALPPDCNALAPKEACQGLVRTEPYESPFEVSELISERIRCGQLIEELQPGVNTFDESAVSEVDETTEGGKTAALAVGVAGTSVVSRNATTNALRSRDEAVRQLDELVRAASASQDSGESLTPTCADQSVLSNQPTLPESPALPPRADLRSGDDQHDSDDHDDDDKAVECVVSDADTPDGEAVGSSIETPDATADENDAESSTENTPDEATVSSAGDLDDFDQEISDPDPVSLLDRLRSNVAAEFENTPLEDDTPPAEVSVPGADANSDDLSDRHGDTLPEPASLLSSMFGNSAADTAASPVDSEVSAHDTTVLQDACAAETSGDSEDTDGLRSQLADMFDLPNLQSDKPADATPLDDRFQSFFGHSETDATDSDDAVGVEAAESNTDLDSETDDPADTNSESGTDTSIQEYMQELLARNRRSDDSPIAAAEKDAEPEPVPQPTVPVDEDESDRSWLTEGPRHKQDRDQVAAETLAFRELANETARSAVVTATRKQLRTAVIVKTVASCLALIFGAVALLLNLPKVFGFGVLGIGMVFTIDLCLTIAKNWTAVSRLAGGDRRKEDDPDGRASDSPESEHLDTPRRRHDDPKPEIEAEVPMDRLARTLQAEIKPGSGDTSLSFEGLLDDTFGDSTDADDDESDPVDA